MAYVCRYQESTSVLQCLGKIKDGLVDAGQTLFDTPDSSSYVLSSNGENGDRPTEYIKIKQSYPSNQGYIYFEPYFYWNATSHTGRTLPTFSTTNWVNVLYSTASYKCHTYFYASKNLCMLRLRPTIIATGALQQNDYQMVIQFGHQDKRIIEKPNTRITSAASSGSNVVLPVSSTEGFKIGGKYTIIGNAGEGRDNLIEVSGIGASDITVVTQNITFGTNAQIGNCPSIFGVNIHNNRYQWGLTHCYAATDGTVANGSGANMAQLEGETSYGDPDVKSGQYTLVPIYIYNNGAALQAYTDSSFLHCNISTDAVVICVLDPTTNYPTYLSPASTMDATSITDANKSWTPSALIGKIVVVTNGVGYGQSRKITANTATKITFNSQTSYNQSMPNNQSEIMIFDHVYKVTCTIGKYILAEEQQ